METVEQLDDEIGDLHARLATLRAQRANLSSVLVSQPHLAARLQNRNERSKSSDDAQQIITQQSKRNLENVYRACAGVTAYRVKDPDPHAANDGNILGISIDVSVAEKFIETYHVLLSVRDKGGKKLLSIYKHTIPPCIPLQQLAAKWLPGSGKDGEHDPEQDLVRFGRLLRKELVSWNMRVDAVRKLRKEAGLIKQRRDSEDLATASTSSVLNAFVSDDDTSSDIEATEDGDGAARVLDIEADAAVRQITITWSDRRTVAMSITKDGRIEKAVCRKRDGTRDVVLGKKAIGPIGSLMQRLMA
ncbi:Cenp-O kinetochore centromere component-domain-containing protein [Bipolaris maydis]|nr:Cenp-O kinetochore centromere component-domain-containing protein [Bipolaris maydis]KAJ6269476.1 Cenp-O kinetochore centromere component-domain-containing protein [Bipolaris maydis]KAJ6280708.1 Cenp-O kinetochore centromere component-domain-containing protein [Bipolaris maydis]